VLPCSERAAPSANVEGHEATSCPLSQFLASRKWRKASPAGPRCKPSTVQGQVGPNPRAEARTEQVKSRQDHWSGLDLVHPLVRLICTKTVSTHEAKTHLARLLAEVEAGEEFVICRGKTPAARLVSTSRKPARRRPKVGTLTSAPVRYTQDAFLPLTDEELKAWGL
jgi:antitoxin (DNA-binding transcriptional repressor) of toxin-antitoxin stability system